MELKRWPEWKNLFDSILPLIAAGERTFPYEMLGELLGGLDPRTGRGRQQFYRFRRELLRVQQLWLENIPRCGYALIEAKDHPGSAFKRVRQGRRKVAMANAINSYVRIEDLTPEQRVLQAATAGVLHELSKTFHAAGRKFEIASKQAMGLPVDLLPNLLKSTQPGPRKKAS